MQTIWKFPVTPTVTLELPKDATILTVQLQHGEPQLWCLPNPEAPRIPRTFEVFGTGQAVPDTVTGLDYCGTLQVERGRLVFHVFERRTAS